jgi:hypothetical protein
MFDTDTIARLQRMFDERRELLKREEELEEAIEKEVREAASQTVGAA